MKTSYHAMNVSAAKSSFLSKFMIIYIDNKDDEMGSNLRNIYPLAITQSEESER